MVITYPNDCEFPAGGGITPSGHPDPVKQRPQYRAALLCLQRVDRASTQLFFMLSVLSYAEN